MNDDALIRLLYTEADTLTRKTADAIVARGSAIVPRLVRILGDNDAWGADEDASWWAPVHAAYLLGAIGGTDVIPPILRALAKSLDKDHPWIYEPMPSILARQGAPAAEPLLAALQDGQQDEAVRLTVAEALELLAVREPALRDGLLDRLAAVARDAVRGEADRWIAAVPLLRFARPQDRDLLLDLGRRQAKQGDGAHFLPDSVEATYRTGPDLADTSEDWMAFYDPEAIAKREREEAEWAAEEEMDGDPDEGDAQLEDVLEGEGLLDPEHDATCSCGHDHGAGRPIVKAGPDVGRNDPCPCGSGKKYKKCCGR
jgi:hypothetical protein